MKNFLLVLSAAVSIVMTVENLLMQEQIKIQAQRYETRLELQEQKYKDEIIDLKQKLYGKTFELDMATNRIEQLNKEIGVIE